jgi:hypothetical protein
MLRAYFEKLFQTLISSSFLAAENRPGGQHQVAYLATTAAVPLLTRALLMAISLVLPPLGTPHLPAENK